MTGVVSPREAEAVVDDLIDRFGTGAIPKVVVVPLDDGLWRVTWEEIARVVAPMDMTAWRAWLEENVGSLDPGDLGTTES